MFYSKIKRVLFHNEEASVLIMTLVVSLMLVVFSAGMLTLVSTDARGTLQTARLDSALNVAEAGVEEALWEFKFGGADFNPTDGWSGSDSKTKLGTLQTNNGETIGQYLTTVTDLSGDPKIEVTGYIPNQANALSQRKIKVLVDKTEESDFNMAAFGTESVDFDKEILTDSYKGDYDPAYVPDKGHIGTDSTDANAITLDKDVQINGNGIVGPGADPEEVISMDASAEITGDKLAATQKNNPQPKPVPTGLTVQPDINVGTGATLTISEGGEYDSIKLGENATLIINADNATLYIKSTLDFDKNSQLEIPDGKSATIYLGAVDFSLDKEVAINNESKHPTAFGIYGTSAFTSTIQIKKETEFYGVIHAPNGTIDINKKAKIYGALVAKKIILDKESAIHYDEALLTAAGGAWSSYSVAKWQEK